MEKRGVSPLIASVLLISFVIIMFVLVSTWVRRSAIEPSMQAGGEKLASMLDCMNTEIEIIDVCSNTDKTLNIKVDNIGDTNLIGLGLRVIGDDKASALEEISVSGGAPYSRISEDTSGLYDISVYGNIGMWKVEVYPKVKSGICRDAMATYSSVIIC